MDKSSFYRDVRPDCTGPLEGVRVLEATTTWAGPMCGCMLADFGAEVIKVEHPQGEIARHSPPFLPGTDPPLSFMHATLNRNKKSLTLDLRKDGGREIFLRLAARADIVVENFRPGRLSSWGVGVESIRAVKADTIYVAISGYGQFGPDHEKIGYDPLAQAKSGFLSLNGDPDGPPVKAPTFLADDLAGLHAALAAMAALHHRDRTGEGQFVDVSLLDSLLFQSTGYLTLGAMGEQLPRMGNEFRIAAPANVYACADGLVMAGAILDSHWRRLARAIGRPELAEHPDFSTTAARLKNRSAVNRLMREWMAPRRMSEVIALFDREEIPIAPVRTYHEAAKDPHVLERDMLQPTLHPESGAERLPITGPAAKFSRTPTRVRHGARALGADNSDILAELGFSEGEVAELREAGAI